MKSASLVCAFALLAILFTLTLPHPSFAAEPAMVQHLVNNGCAVLGANKARSTTSPSPTRATASPAATTASPPRTPI